jgi:hypothetical protein
MRLRHHLLQVVGSSSKGLKDNSNKVSNNKGEGMVLETAISDNHLYQVHIPPESRLEHNFA